MTFRFQPPDNEGDNLGPPPGPFQFRRPGWHMPGGLLRWAVPITVLILLFIIASIENSRSCGFWTWWVSIRDS